jgi:LPXTG-site transpeptidase (sortase) family protein
MAARLRFSSLIITTCLLAACGAAPQQAVPAASVAATPAPASAPASAAASQPAPASGSAQASGTAAARPAAPRELLIPSIHVDAPVEQVGLAADGSMEAPRQWSDVAWFAPGYRPGEPGGAVIAGHLDSTTDRAVFWDLNRLKPGDSVLVKGEDGSQLSYQVAGSEIYPFNQAPLQKIFGPAATSMLNLVTCNGTFDRGSRNYDKRLVVYTRQVSKS